MFDVVAQVFGHEPDINTVFPSLSFPGNSWETDINLSGGFPSKKQNKKKAFETKIKGFDRRKRELLDIKLQ